MVYKETKEQLERKSNAFSGHYWHWKCKIIEAENIIVSKQKKRGTNAAMKALRL